jgi:hypothetical protein
MPDMTPFLIRFYGDDQDIHKKMTEIAEKHDRSLNSEMIVAFKEYLKKHREELEDKNKK